MCSVDWEQKLIMMVIFLWIDELFADNGDPDGRTVQAGLADWVDQH